jgi:hypothetical protein
LEKLYRLALDMLGTPEMDFHKFNAQARTAHHPEVYAVAYAVLCDRLANSGETL